MRQGLLLSLATVLVATTAIAHQGVMNPTVRERMEGMTAMGRQVKVIGQMAKGATDFDAAAARSALERIAARAAATPDLFEEKADDPKSEALPVIWDEFDEFAEIAEELEATALDFAETVSGPEDLGPVLRGIGENCKACHSAYRE